MWLQFISIKSSGTMPHEDPDTRPLGENLQNAEIEEVYEPEYDDEIAGVDIIIGQEPSQDDPNVDVRVLQLEPVYAVELRISPSGTTDYTINRRLTPNSARGLAQQIRVGNSENLVESFSEMGTIQIADSLEDAAGLASELSITEMVGEDVVDAYKNDKISPDEFAHEADRNIERGFEDREDR